MAKKTTIMAQLKKLQEGWAKSEPTRGGLGLPDGLYTTRIEVASLGSAKSSGRLQVAWELIVLDEEFENKKIMKFDGLDNEQSLGFLMGSLETLELEVPDKIIDLGTVLESAAGTLVQIQVKSRDEFTNIYFNGLIDDDDDEEEDDDDDDDEEEEIDAAAVKAMSIKELKAFVKEDGIKIKGYTKMKAGALRKALIKKLDL